MEKAVSGPDLPGAGPIWLLQLFPQSAADDGTGADGGDAGSPAVSQFVSVFAGMRSAGAASAASFAPTGICPGQKGHGAGFLCGFCGGHPGGAEKRIYHAVHDSDRGSGHPQHHRGPHHRGQRGEKRGLCHWGRPGAEGGLEGQFCHGYGGGACHLHGTGLWKIRHPAGHGGSYQGAEYAGEYRTEISGYAASGDRHRGICPGGPDAGGTAALRLL